MPILLLKREFARWVGDGEDLWKIVQSNFIISNNKGCYDGKYDQLIDMTLYVINYSDQW